jgi:hypothetical protein
MSARGNASPSGIIQIRHLAPEPIIDLPNAVRLPALASLRAGGATSSLDYTPG